MMDYGNLLEKHNILLEEANRLKQENRLLKAQLGLMKSEPSLNITEEIKTKNSIVADELIDKNCLSNVDNRSDTPSKICLFMSLFKGREDVYAKRWENKKKGTSGYSPVCLNQWQSGICAKPKIPCSKCENKLYAALGEDVIENHLRGNIVVGVYGNAQESIMRIESPNIANELIKSIESL
ncbi:hypothetical protein ACFL9U_00455 [Thermodesulfobacteriota bacterium]